MTCWRSGSCLFCVMGSWPQRVWLRQYPALLCHLKHLVRRGSGRHWSRGHRLQRRRIFRGGSAGDRKEAVPEERSCPLLRWRCAGQLQYMLSILSDFIPGIPSVAIDGIYGPATRNAVLAAQRRFGLPETGAADANTWLEIYDQFSGIETTALRSRETFPKNGQPANSARAVPASNFRNGSRRSNGTVSSPQTSYRRSSLFTQFLGMDLALGMQDPVSQEVIR